MFATMDHETSLQKSYAQDNNKKTLLLYICKTQKLYPLVIIVSTWVFEHI